MARNWKRKKKDRSKMHKLVGRSNQKNVFKGGGEKEESLHKTKQKKERGPGKSISIGTKKTRRGPMERRTHEKAKEKLNVNGGECSSKGGSWGGKETEGGCGWAIAKRGGMGGGKEI